MECMPVTGSHTDMAFHVSPWYPDRMVMKLHFFDSPREYQYCTAIFRATSTDTDPESQ